MSKRLRRQLLRVKVLYIRHCLTQEKNLRKSNRWKFNTSLWSL